VCRWQLWARQRHCLRTCAQPPGMLQSKTWMMSKLLLPNRYACTPYCTPICQENLNASAARHLTPRTILSGSKTSFTMVSLHEINSCWCVLHMQLMSNCLASAQGFKEELKQWDVSFWAERLREAKFNITDEELRPYFALPNVLKGLFQVGYLLPPHHIARPLCCIPILLHAHCVAFMSCCIPIILHPHYAASPLCCIPILLHPHCVACMSCCIPIILHPHHAASPSCCIPSMLHQHHAASPLCCIFIMLHQLHTACCVLAVLPCCVAASSCRIKLMYRVSFCMLAASHNHFHLVLFTRHCPSLDKV